MLVLSRQIGESVVIREEITVKILEVQGDTVKIGIEAPKDVPIYRQELYQAIMEENRSAGKATSEALQGLKGIFNRDKGGKEESEVREKESE